MFTGLITTTGSIRALKHEAGLIRVVIEAPAMTPQGMKLGASVAVNGICLTVVEIHENGFSAQAMRETVTTTTLKDWSAGDKVNLERALAVTDRFEGHLVSGHVDGIVQVVSIRAEGEARRIEFSGAESCFRYVARKGSVALDGISLTVADIFPGNRFTVSVIPHTLVNTTLAELREGQWINIEIDIVARYVERLVQKQEDVSLTLEKLEGAGF